MLDDRKKTMVLGGLFVMMIGVGAFQMIPKGQPAPPPKKSLSPLPVRVATTARPGSTQSNAATGASTGNSAIGETSAPTIGGSPSDVTPPTPTANSGSPTTPPATPKSAPNSTQNPAAKTAPTPETASIPGEPILAERDPFEAPPEANTSADKPAATAGRATVASNGPSAPIKQISGNLGPVILPEPKSGKDPITGAIGSGIPGSAKTVGAEPTIAWHLVGLMSGAHPLAVLSDAAGNQRLIRAGSSVDPDTKLISVDRDSATVVFRGKTLRLSLVGDQNAK